MNIINIGLILACVAAALILFYLKFLKRYRGPADKTEETAVYAIPYLVEQTRNIFDNILKTDYSELNLNKEETEKNRKTKDTLRASLKKCTHGNLGAKMYVIDYIINLLQSKLGFTEESINLCIPFDQPDLLSAEYKFMILLHIYKKRYDMNALSEFIMHNGLDRALDEGTKVHYEITANDIDLVFRRHISIYEKLTFADKLSIVAQKIYQGYKGLGVIDDIRFMKIDGINCGTSGVPQTFYTYGDTTMLGTKNGKLPVISCNAIWLMFAGKKIHLSFLGFEREAEIDRVVRNACRYNNAPTLSRNRGYIVNTSEDGCRIVGVRPDMSESWALFIRKFDASHHATLETLYPFEHVEKLVDLVHFLVAGCRNTALTGQQATGKTTCLMALIDAIPESYSIRIQEMAFELYLRKTYPNRNILTFQDTPNVSAQAGIELQKKTDGDVNLFGEVAQAAVVPLAIKLGQTGSAMLMFTSHHKTTDDLVKEWANDLVSEGASTDSKMAEETVAQVLKFDIHLIRFVDGTRAIERITEILPHIAEPYPDFTRDDPEASNYELTREFFYRMTDRRVFDTQDILIYDNGVYRFVNDISSQQIQEIRRAFSKSEQQAFDAFLEKMHQEVLENRRNGYVGYSSMDTANHLHFGMCVDEHNNVIAGSSHTLAASAAPDAVQSSKSDYEFNYFEGASVPQGVMLSNLQTGGA